MNDRIWYGGKRTVGKKYQINEVKLEVGTEMTELPKKISSLLSIPQDEIIWWSVKRESIDARDKANIKMVYSVDFNTKKDISKKLMKKNKCTFRKEYDKTSPKCGSSKIKGRVVIAGFGPCGIFAALELGRRGYKPLVIERGKMMNERVKDVDDFVNNRRLNNNSNYLFGEGGEGTFSDGKLTTGIKDPNIRYVLETFAKAGAGEEIIYKSKPHIGTDVLRGVITNIRKEILSLGGDILFNSKLINMEIKSGELSSISVQRLDKEGEIIEIPTNALILAIGHSARDTYKMLNDIKIDMEQKPLSIGVRMEHPQELIDRAMYGDEKRLPPADYKLSYKASNGRGVYSFCMCPGGEVINCTTEDGEICVNGMSNRLRNSGTANSGILADVRTSDFEGDDDLAGVRFQERYERLAFLNGGKNFNPPSCTMRDFLNGRAKSVISSLPSFAYEAIREAVPYFAKKIKGYDDEDAIIKAVETRSSAPVRILRDEKGMSTNARGIYPAGEGSGYAGGITSAACDGIKQANRIIERFSNEEI